MSGAYYRQRRVMLPQDMRPAPVRTTCDADGCGRPARWERSFADSRHYSEEMVEGVVHMCDEHSAPALARREALRGAVTRVRTAIAERFEETAVRVHTFRTNLAAMRTGTKGVA